TQPDGRVPLGPSGGGGGPSGPAGPRGPGDAEGGPHHPWWKSVPRVALITVLAVAAVALGLVFTRSGGGGGSLSGGEVFLQAADKTGPDPFTESSATDSSAAPQTPSPAGPTQSANVTRAVDGAAPGLYGGTRNVASCDTEKQIRAL